MRAGEEALAFATGVTRAWTHFYTAGLPDLLRGRRRAEIESDLWELVDDVRAGRTSEAAAALQVIARCILGIADDVAWRLDETPPRAVPAPLLWTGAVMVVAMALGAWLATATRIELPPPAPRMTFVEAPPPPPPPPVFRTP